MLQLVCLNAAATAACCWAAGLARRLSALPAGRWACSGWPITVPASCTQFTINLTHAGKMPIAAMGHNLVVAKEADMAGIAADGASNAAEHVKEGDARSIAHTKIIGGGESTSVTFDVAKIKDGGPFKFFCSFPGHLALMQGSIQVQ